jgi:diguanylate cyclase (GGDEF)-like protein
MKHFPGASYTFLSDQIRQASQGRWVFIAILILIAIVVSSQISIFVPAALILILIVQDSVLRLRYARIDRSENKNKLEHAQNTFLIQSLIDTAVLVASMHLTGGTLSAMPMVLIIYIGTLATVFPRRQWFILNAVAIVFYTLMAGSHNAGYLHPPQFPLTNFELPNHFGVSIQAAYTLLLVFNGLLVSQRSAWLQRTWYASDEQRIYLDRLNALMQLGLSHTGSRDLSQTLADQIGELLGADGAYITLWDEERQIVSEGAAYGPYRESFAGQIAQHLRPSLTESICKVRQTLLVEDTRRSPYTHPRIQESFSRHSSMMGIPMFGMPDRKFIGAILLSYETRHTFTAEEVRRAEQAAELAALLVTRVRLHEETFRRAEMLEQLSMHVTDLTSDLKRTTLLPAIVESARGLLRAERAALYLIDPADGKARCEFSIGLSEEFIAQFIQRSPRLISDGDKTASILIPDVWQDSRTSPLQDLIAKEKFKAYATFGLKSAESSIGALSVYWDQPHAISSEEVAVGNLFAVRAANMLRNASLFAEVAEQSLTDPLTNLPNRRFLASRLEDEAKRTLRYERPFALMMLDLDGFKAINDTFGHPIGDSVLIQVTTCLNRAIRNTDFLARYGGDEFAVILPEADLLKALYVADKIRQTLTTTDLHLPNDVRRRLSACIGISFYPSDSTAVNELMEIADRRMYKAKRKEIGSVVYMDGGKDTKPIIKPQIKEVRS